MAQQTIWNGNETWSPRGQQGQVYLATHDETGNLLPVHKRSFISFSWSDDINNPVYIENFNLIVTIDGKTWERGVYSPFSDSTTELETLDGQYFWKSVYSANEIELTLSTDGVDEATLQAFRHHFRPGIIRKLVFAEASNRYAYARVSDVPEISMVPFEERVSVNIGGKKYTTSTTKWRGDISLTFVLDEPFWYSIRTLYSGDNLTEEEVKSIVEDGIPHVDMFTGVDNDKIILLGNGYTVQQSEGSVTFSTGTFDFDGKEVALYNCGTAPAKPVLFFSFQVDLDKWEDVQEVTEPYIIFPASSYSTGGNTEYNYIRVGNRTFLFTTPGILTSYNHLVKILYKDFEEGNNLIDLKNAIQNSITDIYVRMWGLGIIELALAGKLSDISTSPGENSPFILASNYREAFVAKLKKMFLFANNEPTTFDFVFDSKTGKATTTFKLRVLDVSNLEESSSSSIDNYISDPDKSPTITENVGDMIRSNYLTIDERTTPSAENSIDFDECLIVNADTDSKSNLKKISINYRYMYL